MMVKVILSSLSLCAYGTETSGSIFYGFAFLEEFPLSFSIFSMNVVSNWVFLWNSCAFFLLYFIFLLRYTCLNHVSFFWKWVFDRCPYESWLYLVWLEKHIVRCCTFFSFYWMGNITYLNAIFSLFYRRKVGSRWMFGLRGILDR